MALSNYFATQPVGQPQRVQPAGTPSYMAGTLPAQNFQMPMAGGMPNAGMGAMPVANTDYNTQLSQSLEHFMDPNSAYIQNARQRGAEQAAVRGGVNSSIAAGASERAALEAAMPLAQTATGMSAGQQGMMQQARLSEWAEQQGFNRELYMRPFASSVDMLGRVTEMGLQDPELYSPSVISGYSNFFNQQMGDMMRRYFGG